jgi:hypothetical protein
MSEDGRVHGLLITIKDRMFFIPRDELRNYRVPDDAAERVRAQVRTHLEDLDAEGFATPALAGRPRMFGVVFNPDDGRRPVEFSGIANHAITVILASKA